MPYRSEAAVWGALQEKCTKMEVFVPHNGAKTN